MAATLSFRFMDEKEIRTWVLANPEHVNEKDSYRTQVLRAAAMQFADPALITWLIEQGCDVDGDDPTQPPILCPSADVISVLLEKGANPLTQDYLGRTALMVHAMRARADCVERLLQSPRVRETIDMLGSGHTSHRWWGGTALHLACWNGDLGVSKTRTIELLLLHGANPIASPTLTVPPRARGQGLAPPILRTPLQILRNKYPNDHGSISLLERAVTEPTRIFWLFKAHHQIDAFHSLTTIAEDAHGTTEEKQAMCVARAPMYLKERVVAGHLLPVVELKKKEILFSFSFFTGVEEDGEEKKLLAVLSYVLRAQEGEEKKEQGGGSKNENGGMSADVFVELMEMIAPKWDPIRGGGEA